MADKVKVTSASIHAVMRQFCNEKIKNFALQRKAFKDCYDVIRTNPTVVKDIDTLVELSKEKWTNNLSENIVKAQTISALTTSIRRACNLGSTILTKMHEVVQLGDLADYSAQLVQILDIMKKKARAQGNNQQQTSTKADTVRMVQDFAEELELSKLTGCLSQQWLNSNQNSLPRAQRAHQFWISNQDMDEMKEIKLDSLIDDAALTDQEADKIKIPIENKVVQAKQANAFMMDYVLNAVVAAKRFELTDVYWEKIAAYSRLMSQGTLAWANFVNKNAWAKVIPDSKMTLYENPLSFSVDRVVGLSAFMYTSAHPQILLMAIGNSCIGPIFSQIYVIETNAGLISDMAQTTSQSEHLIHQLISMARQPSVHCNKNYLDKSFVSVSFEFLEGKGPVSFVAPVFAGAKEHRFASGFTVLVELADIESDMRTPALNNKEKSQIQDRVEVFRKYVNDAKIGSLMVETAALVRKSGEM